MKKILTLLFLFFAVMIGFAQAPNMINYQGIARNSVGNVLPNQAISVKLSIRDLTATGAVVYSEIRNVTTNFYGLFSFGIGSPGATGVTGTIAGVNWAVGAKFLQVEIDPGGGSSFTNVGTTQLLSVPYSLYSNSSGGFLLPFVRVQSDAGPLFSLTNSGAGDAIVGINTGTGRGGYFQINNAASTADALRAETNGTGASWAIRGISTGTQGAALFVQSNATNTANNVQSNQAGLGRAGFFQITNAASTATTFQANTNGLGSAGRFDVTNSANVTAALDVNSDGATASRNIRAINTGLGSVLELGINNNTNINNVFSATTNGLGRAALIQSTNTANNSNIIEGFNAGPGWVANLTSNNATPKALRTEGALQFTGIGEALNRVLTSDASGNATWQAVGGGGLGAVLGSGTLNYVPKWTPDGNTLGNSLIFDNGTNVGIGTTTPTTPLQIATGAGQYTTALSILPSTHATSKRAALNLDDWLILQDITGGSNTKDFAIYQNSSGLQRLVISPTGNIGIGTLTPAAKFQVTDFNIANNALQTPNLFLGATGIGVIDQNAQAANEKWGIFSYVNGNTNQQIAVFGDAGYTGTLNTGLYGNVWDDPTPGIARAIRGVDNIQNVNTYAGLFTGRVHVIGDLTATGVKPFTIDHPLDPENKLLRHFSMESPEVLNVYSGNTITDANGKATVMLPDYFESINKDYRYQLTVIGTFAQAIISKEVNNNQFEVATSQPNVKVSWEVKAARNDLYMKNVNKLKAVEEKPSNMKGKYMNAKAYGLPASKGMDYEGERQNISQQQSKPLPKVIKN